MYCVIPVNRLEALKGTRQGQHSIRINEVVLKKRAITADTALRLAKYFGTTERLWVGLQDDYDVEEARRKIVCDTIQLTFR